MRVFKYFFASVILCLSASPTFANEKGGDIDVKEIILEHISDSYGWHITSWKGKDIAIPLPVIVRGSNGWDFFMSSRVAHGKSYEGYYIAAEGAYKGKLVELINGMENRPFDLSITKNVLAILINSVLMLVIILSVSRWHKKKKMQAPGGFIGAVEMLVMTIQDDVIKKCVGKDYERYSPFLLTAFFFILINNAMGLIPVFPGGANTTGNIAITLVLALFTFVIANISGTKEYWKEILWPDVPMWLKVPIPLIPVIEIFGIFSKPFALVIRLFANIMAGHSIILGITCLIFITYSMGVAVNVGMTVISVILSFFMGLIELLVAFIQAYIFTMLSAVFIGLARVKHEHSIKK